MRPLAQVLNILCAHHQFHCVIVAIVIVTVIVMTSPHSIPVWYANVAVVFVNVQCPVLTHYLHPNADEVFTAR